MSKVEAYICDFGAHLMAAKYIVGVSAAEDLFDKQRSYPTVFNPTRVNIHYCLECYKEHVLLPAGRQVDRKKDERLYELKVNELSYGMRLKTVQNWRERQRGGKKVSK